MDPRELQPGDLVWYRQPKRGGYGCAQWDVPGVYLRIPRGRRVEIAVTVGDGTTRHLTVEPKNLRRRSAGE